MADRSLGKGPLRTILGAASCDSKLTKSIYASIDISTAVELIMNPEVPLAMRMSVIFCLELFEYTPNKWSLLLETPILS
ncbi:hypothetical protein DCAR_0205644 [Daucus carota subsp. sativus]|uniref:Uncharacterized protein n=1 Tax=Daucus carota subsp. sativus TaxID=79200 RepID=A0A175Y9T8_DAUCS|nr:hypothetical protein DCAR_0205644 [Daucus carota subsp. sativus]